MGTSKGSRRPARENARLHSDSEIWIDHAEIVADDFEWLRRVEWLTLWNVTTPPGFLASLPQLWALDIRGGSSLDLESVDGCRGLRCLIVNQVRGLHDLAVVGGLTALEFLMVYGLKQVEVAPSLGDLRSLRRLEVGQMRGLASLGGLLDAPAIEDLCLTRWVTVTTNDLERIRAHPSLRRFEWFGEDVPVFRWRPVVEAVNLPKLNAVRPHEWFDSRERP